MWEGRRGRGHIIDIYQPEETSWVSWLYMICSLNGLVTTRNGPHCSRRSSWLTDTHSDSRMLSSANISTPEMSTTETLYCVNSVKLQLLEEEVKQISLDVTFTEILEDALATEQRDIQWINVLYLTH